MAHNSPQCWSPDDKGAVRHERRHFAPKGCRKKQRVHDGGRRKQVHRTYLGCEQDVIRPEGIQTRAGISTAKHHAHQAPGTKAQVAQVGPLLDQMRHALGVF